MNRAAMAVAALMASISWQAFAADFFLGGGLSHTRYPDWAGIIDRQYYADGATGSSTTQGGSEPGVGLHGGVWLTRNIGFELGLDYLGKARGTSQVVFGRTGGSGSYNYTAGAAHVAALAAINFERAALYAKLGAQRSATTLDGDYLPGTHKAFASNALYGAGWTYRPFARVSIRAEWENFRGVKFVDYVNYARNTTATLHTYSIGADYHF